MKNRVVSFNRCDWFVFIYSLYLLQDILYSRGIINQALQVIFVVWGLVIACKCVLTQPKAPHFLKAVVLLLIMFLVYGGIALVKGSIVVNRYSQELTGVNYMQHALNSLLPIFVFYDYTRLGLLTSERIRKYLLLLLPMTILLFVKNMALADGKEITNNVGYMMLSLLPYVYLFHKSLSVQYLYLSILMFFVIFSVKRGAILIFAISVVYFLFALRKRVSLNKIVNVLLSATFVGFAVFIVQSRIHVSDYFNERIAQTLEGNMSGRDVIYLSILNEITQDTDFINFMFGRGANSTMTIAGHLAHQDWLEIACNNGLIGVCLFVYFFLSLLRSLINAKRSLPVNLFDMFLTLSFIIFAKSLLSMSIHNIDLSLAILLGYLVYQSSSGGKNELSS